MTKTENKHSNTDDIYELGTIPFMIGPSETSHNANGLPDTLPFSYFHDQHTNVLRQVYAENVENNLQTAYDKGSILAIPMDDEGEGSHYLFDFLGFIKQSIIDLDKKDVLEIGCGRGFLIKHLKKTCRSAIGVEPGKSQKQYWLNNDVNVINDFFPTPHLSGTFDVIIAYCVLEHIYDAANFVKSIHKQLSDGGKIILAVPDCEDQLKNCDPSLFYHEHYSYFSRDSLSYFLESQGFKTSNVTFAGYGGAIYICAEKTNLLEKRSLKNIEKYDVNNFAKNVTEFINYIKSEVEFLKQQGKTLGIYCAGRALIALPIGGQYRFFDDDDQIYGRYHPPFPCPIENRQDLLDKPVDVIWIFSYSFGDKIKKNLTQHSQLANTDILTLNELRKKQ